MDRHKIRSAQFIDTYFPILDGVVRTVHNYASEMNRISGSFVVCPKQKGSYDDSTLPYDVIRSASVKLPVMNYALALPADPVCLKKVLRRGDFDIVHVHSPFMMGVTGLIAARRMKVPVVATFHSKYYSDILQVTKSRFLAKSVTDGIVGFYNLCDEVWACSEGTAETLRSYGYKKKIIVMPNGTDLKRPEDPKKLQRRAEQEFHLTSDKITLLFTGSLIWQKNLRTILKTFKILEKVRPEQYRLVLAGTGNHEKEIKEYAKKLDLKNVQFTGGIYDRELLFGLYSAADLFFFPSIYDNAPLVVREAAVCATPTLAAAGSNSAEVILPDINGYVAENDPRSMAKKILQITSDRPALARAGQKALETIPVPWRKIMEDVYEEYASLIRRKK